MDVPQMFALVKRGATAPHRFAPDVGTARANATDHDPRDRHNLTVTQLTERRRWRTLVARGVAVNTPASGGLLTGSRWFSKVLPSAGRSTRTVRSTAFALPALSWTCLQARLRE